MRLIYFSIGFLFVSLCAFSQATETATYPYTLPSKYMDRIYDQVFPLSEERQVLAVFCDKDKDVRTVKLLLLDSLLKPIAEKVIRYESPENLCMARVKEKTIYTLFYDIKTGKGSTRNYSLASLETTEEFKFELTRGLEFKTCEILNNVYFVGGTNTLALSSDPNVVCSINKGKVVSGTFKYDKMGVQYYPKMYIVDHEKEPEFFAVFDDQDSFTPDNYIVRFNKHGERLPDIFLKNIPVPLQTDVYIHDFSVKKISTDNYALFGVFSTSATKSNKRGLFTARFNKNEIMFFKKFRLCDLDGFNAVHSIKDSSCNKNTYETSISISPIIPLGDKYCALVEFGYDTKYRAGGVVMLDAKGEWIWSQAFRAIIKRELILSQKKEAEEFNVAGTYDMKTVSFRKYNSEKFVAEYEYVLNHFIKDELPTGTVIAEFWYGTNILVYEDANHLFQSKTAKEFEIKKIGR